MDSCHEVIREQKNAIFFIYSRPLDIVYGDTNDSKIDAVVKLSTAAQRVAGSILERNKSSGCFAENLCVVFAPTILYRIIS